MSVDLRYWHGLIRVTHPDGWLQGMLYMLLGTYLGGGFRALQSAAVMRAAGVVGLIIAAGFAFNDFHDADVDGVNRPWRAIPSKEIPKPAARNLAGVLAAASIVLTLSLPPVLWPLAMVNLLASASYTLVLKNMPIVGHLVIAYLNTTILLFGCMTVRAPTPIVWLVSLAGGFFTLAQETILAVVDEPGDRSNGLCTTAVRFGIGPTLILFRIFAFFPIFLMLLPGLLRFASNLYVWSLVPCTIVPIVMAVRQVTPKYTKESISLSSKLILWSRALSLLPVLLLGMGR